MAFDLQVFNEQTRTVMTETVDQDIAKFNEASGGTIVLMNKPFEGDFSITSAFQSISGLVRRRDAHGSGSVAAKRLQEMLNVAVKVAAGTHPIEFEPQQYKWTLRNPELAAVKIGEQLAKARLADMLNAAIRCGVTAISGNAAMVQDGSAAAPNFNVLNTGASKMGDRSSSLRSWAMHSGTMHKLWDGALTNTERLFTYDGVNVIRDPFGRVFVVTDAPDLVDTTGADPVYKTLGLVEGAIVAQDSNDFYATMQEKTGGENITAVYQAEWSYGVGVKGYAWNMSAGGASPSDTALGTKTNWTKKATSNKDTAGVLVLTK